MQFGRLSDLASTTLAQLAQLYFIDIFETLSKFNFNFDRYLEYASPNMRIQFSNFTCRDLRSLDRHIDGKLEYGIIY
jgi:hypothetical protein